MTSGRNKSARLRTWWRPVALAVVVLGLFVTTLVIDFGPYLGRAGQWIEGLGHWAPPVFIAFYIVASVLMVPATALIVLAGALFGGVWGGLYVCIGIVGSAASAFLISRYVARRPIERWVTHRAKYKRFDRLTRKHGAVFVGIMHVTPFMPFNVLNYAFGLTNVRLWTYLLWAFLGTMPGTIALLAGTDAIVRWLRGGPPPWFATLAALVALTSAAAISWFAARKLRAWSDK